MAASRSVAVCAALFAIALLVSAQAQSSEELLVSDYFPIEGGMTLSAPTTTPTSPSVPTKRPAFSTRSKAKNAKTRSSK
uniref:Uncharacterized protein n=1 Tax=Steinernema glaseri TaxID=37863 RepID=A0A1I7ZM01_9BILA